MLFFFNSRSLLFVQDLHGCGHRHSALPVQAYGVLHRLRRALHIVPPLSSAYRIRHQGLPPDVRDTSPHSPHDPRQQYSLREKKRRGTPSPPSISLFEIVNRQCLLKPSKSGSELNKGDKVFFRKY